MIERDFFERLNWILFLIFEFVSGFYLGYLWDKEQVK
jgi:hypothetical protein